MMGNMADGMGGHGMHTWEIGMGGHDTHIWLDKMGGGNLRENREDPAPTVGHCGDAIARYSQRPAFTPAPTPQR